VLEPRLAYAFTAAAIETSKEKVPAWPKKSPAHLTYVIADFIDLYIQTVRANPFISLELLKMSSFDLEKQPLKFKLNAIALFFSSILIGGFAVYWIATHVLPLYGRLSENAIVIEVQYPAFGLFSVPPVMLVCLIGSLSAFITGKRFSPRPRTFLHYFQTTMLYLFLIGLAIITPLASIITTIALNKHDYTSCPQLRKSGSAWQTFWVSHPAFCFKPDSFTEDNWPCKHMNGKKICLSLD
jgi:hypothetical protein